MYQSQKSSPGSPYFANNPFHDSLGFQSRLPLTTHEWGRNSISRDLSYLTQYRLVLSLLVLVNVILNLTDFATSVVALRAGLTEGNTLILGISTVSGLNILESLAVVKILFIALAASVALIGARSTKKSTVNLMMGFLLISTAIFLVVSLSNIHSIVA